VTTGPEAIPSVVAMAKANKGIWFIGVDQAPCVGAAGALDPKGVCAGDIAKILPRYMAITYAEDQAGYLAGIVAASATRSGVIGAIGGTSTCGPCVKYMQGYILGAKSVMPTAKVNTGFVSVNDARLGFSDQLAGNTYATAFIKANAGLDVLFQVADRTDVGGLTGNGIIDAACAAGIKVIGVDVDQHQAYPASQACILTSAEKSVSASVSDSIVAIAAMTAVGGLTTYNVANEGISISPFYAAADKLQAGTDARIAAALGAMKAGSLVTCPPSPQCGKTPAPKLGD
jgi:basic membrane protein A